MADSKKLQGNIYLMKKLINDNGMSMMTSMVALIIVTGSSLTIMNMMRENRNSLKRHGEKGLVKEAHRSVMNFLKVQENCDYTFAGVNFGTFLLDTNEIITGSSNIDEYFNTFVQGKGAVVEKPLGILQSYNRSAGADVSVAGIGDAAAVSVGGGNKGVRLIGLYLVDPDVASNRIVGTAPVRFGDHKYVTSTDDAVVKDTELNMNGWNIIVGFIYSKLRSVAGAAPGHVGEYIIKYERFRLKNFGVADMRDISSEAQCDGTWDVIASGRYYPLFQVKIGGSTPTASADYYGKCATSDPNQAVVSNFNDAGEPDLLQPNGCFLQ